MKNLLDNRISSRFVKIDTGLKVHYLECNKNNKNLPTILLLHGFPELSFSWRRIMPMLFEKGFRVIAIDQRGYGKTIGDAKKSYDDINQYNLFNLTLDIISFLNKIKIKKIKILIGHDAGSIIAGTAALIRPDLFNSLVMMSAPFTGVPKINDHNPKDNIHEELKLLSPPRKHYQWYYSSNKANKDMHLRNKSELHKFLRSYFHVKSADWSKNKPFELKSWSAKELEKLPEYYIMKYRDTMVDSVIKYYPKKNVFDKWLNDKELDVYTSYFHKNGFQSSLNWYKCMTSKNYNDNLKIFDGKLLTVPSIYISGEKDWGMFQKPGALKQMKKLCSNFKGIKVVKNAGHWVQQENPKKVVELILKFNLKN